jgi:hypothetical protein
LERHKSLLWYVPAILGKFIIEADCLNIKNGSKLVFIGIDIILIFISLKEDHQ